MPIAWIGSRYEPGQDSVQWVVHASEDWSRQNIEADPQTVAQQLADQFEIVTGISVFADSAVAHRWRYGRVQQPLTDACLFDNEALIGACGDWCGGKSRVESAWLSGQAIAGRVLATAMLSAERSDGVQTSLL